MTVPPNAEGKSSAWNQPPTVKFWVIVIGIIVVIAAAIFIGKAVSAQNNDLDEYNELKQQECVHKNFTQDAITKCLHDAGVR